MIKYDARPKTDAELFAEIVKSLCESGLREIGNQSMIESNRAINWLLDIHRVCDLTAAVAVEPGGARA